MSIRPLVLALPALALLAGCADEPAPAPAPAPARAPVAAPAVPPAPSASFDGRYIGTVTRANSAPRTCRPAQGRAQAMIQNGQVRLSWARGMAPLVGALNAAGEGKVANEGAVADIKVNATTLSGQASADNCVYTLALQKRVR
jgi:hypothetical protein